MSDLPLFDWVSRHDERSKKYPIRTEVSPIKPRNKLWVPGPILDQGSEGQCIGFGWAAEALATPVRVDINKIKVNTPREPNAFASFIYNTAKTLDETPGEDYEGTSVLAGAKAMQSLNLLIEYRWAFSIDDIVLALMTTGPVVLGLDWTESMYEAPQGILVPTGRTVGGHCILAIGYQTASSSLQGEPGIILQNSWGESWGNKGTAIITPFNLYTLMKYDGEACVPFKRSYGRK